MRGPKASVWRERKRRSPKQSIRLTNPEVTRQESVKGKRQRKYQQKRNQRKERNVWKNVLRVADVMEILGVSENYAYKLIRKLNKEMQEMGFQTIQGRIDTKFFYEHFYQTKDYERRNA